jgi:dipeptidase D
MKPDDYPVDPPHLWEHFYRLTQIPRPSRQEEAVRRYTIEQAESGGHSWRGDAQGNLVVSVAASPGREHGPKVTVQNHLDMVTVKTADKTHDFTRDPLDLVVEDGWLRADRTTLGADNGVGCAAALALMTDPAVTHPPLELLFTVDEETGLGGALNLDPDLLQGDLMLNLDTEDWNELYIGCAGGGGWEFTREFTSRPAADSCWRLSLAGLAGGHSGIQIHEQLGNAAKLLGQCLEGLPGLQLASVDIGVAHNVIPREGWIDFSAPEAAVRDLESELADLEQRWRGYLPQADHGLQLSLSETAPAPLLDQSDSRAVLDLVAAWPHGAQAYNLQQPAELVDLSINLAILRLSAGKLFVESSYRFFNEAQSEPLQQAVQALARAYQLAVKPVVGYPGWQPDFDSPLLARAVALHQELFGSAPAVKAIHAGLECGILKGKKPDTDILSFGPTIKGAHSPGERLKIDTVVPFWRFLTELLARL